MCKLPKSSNQSSSNFRRSSSSVSLEETTRSSDTSSEHDATNNNNDNDDDNDNNNNNSDGFKKSNGNEHGNNGNIPFKEQQKQQESSVKSLNRKRTSLTVSTSSCSRSSISTNTNINNINSNSNSNSIDVRHEGYCGSLLGQAGVFKNKYKAFIGIILILPILLILLMFYQGISLLLQYRTFFGDHAPIPFSPSHGVVAASPNPSSYLQLEPKLTLKQKLKQTLKLKLKLKQPLPHDEPMPLPLPKQDLYAKESEQFHFKKYNDTNPFTNKSLHLTPIRLLVIGDSIACGVGQVTSCYPLMPEALGAILSKEYGGRPVFWSVFGQSGATIKWVKGQVRDRVTRVNDADASVNDVGETTQENESHLSMQEFLNLSREQVVDSVEREQEEWVRKLKYHQQLYDINPFAGYDYIIVISGVNDIKSILVPFLIQDDAETNKNNVESNAYERNKEWGFEGNLKRLVRDLHKIAHVHDQNIDDDSCAVGKQGQTCTSITATSIDRKLPYIVFPQFPVRLVPAEIGLILRWIAIKSTDIVDTIKARVADEDPDHLFAVPSPGFPDNGFNYDISEPWLPELLREDEVLMQLSNFNRKECHQLADDMQAFYSTRKAKQKKNMIASEMFSNDAMHPNDWGYDYFGRFLGKEIMQRRNAGLGLDAELGNER